MAKKLTIDDFIFKSKLIHGDKYDYSQTIYKSIKDLVIIVCGEHGKFEQIAEKHLMGRGCKLCGVIKQKMTCLKKYGKENPFS